jgi:hypothetical protein
LPKPHHVGKDEGEFSLPKAINALEHLTLNYGQNLMSFEFAALHFTNPMKNQYAYQLQGWDLDWITVDAKFRRATYTIYPLATTPCMSRRATPMVTGINRAPQ